MLFINKLKTVISQEKKIYFDYVTSIYNHETWKSPRFSNFLKNVKRNIHQKIRSFYQYEKLRFGSLTRKEKKGNGFGIFYQLARNQTNNQDLKPKIAFKKKRINHIQKNPNWATKFWFYFKLECRLNLLKTNYCSPDDFLKALGDTPNLFLNTVEK